MPAFPLSRLDGRGGQGVRVDAAARGDHPDFVSHSPPIGQSNIDLFRPIDPRRGSGPHAVRLVLLCRATEALAELGYKTADCIVWDVDDEQTDVLLATLNRLGGSDRLGKKLKLLKRLNRKMAAPDLAKLVPQTAKQIERLVNLKMPAAPSKINARCFANPLVFFVNDSQKQQIERALSLVEEPKQKMTKAAKRAAALAHIAQYFFNIKRLKRGVSHDG